MKKREHVIISLSLSARMSNLPIKLDRSTLRHQQIPTSTFFHLAAFERLKTVEGLTVWFVNPHHEVVIPAVTPPYIIERCRDVLIITVSPLIRVKTRLATLSFFDIQEILGDTYVYASQKTPIRTHGPNIASEKQSRQRDLLGVFWS